MRTTLTLDDDVADKVKETAARQGTSFKETVNALLRRGLSAQESSSRRPKPFSVRTFRSAFRAGVDPLRLNQMSDELEVQDSIDRISGRGGA